MPAGRDNRSASGGAGRQQTRGEREQAQSDELRADGGSRVASGSADRGLFRAGARRRRPEDARYGVENAGSVESDEIKRRECRLAKIRQAKVELEAEARAAAEARREERRKKEDEAAAKGKKPGGRPPKIDETPKPEAQRSFTDPESRIMKGATVRSWRRTMDRRWSMASIR